jgi:NADPH:quinone reductase-like Zn-dependent oxidoreductase
MKKWIRRILGGIVALLVLGIVALALIISHTSDCPVAEAAPADAELMTAVIYRCYGSPDVLEVTEVEKPVPADNEVLVKVQAASVNPLDWHYMRGSPYLMRLASGLGSPDDIRMGVDFAGTVESVGSSVTQFQPGDEVFGRGNGAFAEYVIDRADRGIVHKPADVSFEQAAALPIAAITALQALRDKGELKPGQKVLINGASGGVGTYAVQIAKAMGAEVHGVCSTRNLELVRSLGADYVFDYRNEDYTESDQTYDLIVDMVGNHSLLKNRRVLTEDGALVVVGGSKGNWIAPLKRPLGVMILGPFVDQKFKLLLASITNTDLEQLAEYVRSGAVRSVIDQRFSLSEVPDAIRYSEAGRARGKIMIRFDDN